MNDANDIKARLLGLHAIGDDAKRTINDTADHIASLEARIAEFGAAQCEPVAFIDKTYVTHMFMSAEYVRAYKVDTKKMHALYAAPPSIAADQVRDAALEEAKQLLLNGSFLHDQAPGALLAREAAKAIDRLKSAPAVEPVGSGEYLLTVSGMEYEDMKTMVETHFGSSLVWLAGRSYPANTVEARISAATSQPGSDK